MRIPTYQKQINYQRGYARTVQLAGPTLESSGSRGWSILAAIGGAMEGAGHLYKYLEKKKEEQRKKKEQEAAQKPDGGENPNPKENPNGQTQKDCMYSGFTCAARQSLLSFSREKAFAPQATQDAAASDAVERLDDYFAQQAAAAVTDNTHPDRSLPAQDYVVLRQEVQQIQAEQQKKIQQAQFMQGANSFVQVAGLIRTPVALQQYIEANLSAAQAESEKSTANPVAWKHQKQQLYAAAVQHNVEAALSAGETEQARAVYEHFANHLPAQSRELLDSKVSACQADECAEKIWPQAYATCVSENKEIEEKQLDNFVQNTMQEQPINRGALKESLRACLREQIGRQYRQQAGLCRQLLQAQNSGEKNLWQVGATYPSSEVFEQMHKLWKGMQAGSKKSDPAVFNMLYEQAGDLSTGRQAIMQAYDKQKISARDALLLTEHFCNTQAGEQDAYAPLLWRAVQGICNQMQLSASETEQAQYQVFSAGCDRKTQLAAAQELKQLLTLQEKKK